SAKVDRAILFERLTRAFEDRQVGLSDVVVRLAGGTGRIVPRLGPVISVVQRCLFEIRENPCAPGMSIVVGEIESLGQRLEARFKVVECLAELAKLALALSSPGGFPRILYSRKSK